MRISKLKTELARLLTALLLIAFITGCEQSNRQSLQQVAEPPAETQAREDVSSAEEQTVESQDLTSPQIDLAPVFSHIDKGDFAAAAELLDQAAGSSDPKITALLSITDQYELLQQRREPARQKAFEEQTAELEKLREEADLDDPNDIVEIFSTTLKAIDVADEEQKQEILNDELLKQAIDNSLAKAVESEEQGQWLDAYTNSYYWLKEIDTNNKIWEEIAEELEDKALIHSALQDSPCEQWRQRYLDIGPDQFKRTLRLLHNNYVTLVDYTQMAEEAVKRCHQLGEVVARIDEETEDSLARPEEEQLLMWQAGLSALSKQVKLSITGITSEKFVSIFEETLDLNAATIQLPQEVVITNFVQGALSALDPHTNLIWPQQVSDFRKLMTKEFTGIGIEITKDAGWLKVSSLLPDTPAYNSGLDADDIIEEVDGIGTEDMPLTCAVKKITGPAGTKVKLTVRSPKDEETREIVITRARIIVPTIRGWQRTEAGQWRYMIDEEEKIGYIRITDFAETTARDLKKAMDILEDKGLRGLVLDVRFNSGGYLKSAIDVVDKFVDKGLIVSTRPRFAATTFERAKRSPTYPACPLVVLINGSSASASEIVAGALQDEKFKRAVIVGGQSYGKGSVQTIVDYPGRGAQLKYTMAYYHLPSNQRVQNRYDVEKQDRTDWGIQPDIEVKLRNDELKTMMDARRENSVLVKADHDGEVGPMKRHSLEETLEKDIQLAVAVLVVKTKLIEQQVKIAAVN